MTSTPSPGLPALGARSVCSVPLAPSLSLSPSLPPSSLSSLPFHALARTLASSLLQLPDRPSGVRTTVCVHLPVNKRLSASISSFLHVRFSFIAIENPNGSSASFVCDRHGHKRRRRKKSVKVVKKSSQEEEEEEEVKCSSSSVVLVAEIIVAMQVAGVALIFSLMLTGRTEGIHMRVKRRPSGSKVCYRSIEAYQACLASLGFPPLSIESTLRNPTVWQMSGWLVGRGPKAGLKPVEKL